MKLPSLSDIWLSYSFPNNAVISQNSIDSLVVNGFSGSSDAFFIADLFRQTKRQLIVVVENTKKAEILAEECRSLLEQDSVLFFPSRDAVPYNFKSPFGPTTEARFTVLNALLEGKRNIIIIPVPALLQKIPSHRDFFKKIVHLHCNDEIAIDSLATWLIELGFHRESQISDIGMFSIRGGIIDIYPFLSEHPYRIEFWGNTIDSIRKFDIFTQKSMETCNKVSIFPLKEFVFSALHINSAIEKIESECTSNPEQQVGIQKLLHQWKLGDLEGSEWFLHWFTPETVSILDYVASDTIIVWNDFFAPRHRFDEVRKNYLRHRERAPAIFSSLLSSEHELLFSDTYIEELLNCFKCIYLDTTDIPPLIKRQCIVTTEQPQLPRDLNAILENIHCYVSSQYSIFLVCPNLGHGERMTELLGDSAPFLRIMIGYISHGFIDKINNVVFYSESQLIHTPKKNFSPKKRLSSLPICGLDALTPDDYIVHEDHGIARFLGIEHITAGTIRQDCMVLLYAEGTKIYVPVADFYKVQKYIGKDGSHPPLSKIGTTSWEKLKEKTRESIQAMAAELIELYAKRQFFEGIQFHPDTIWQKEFEDAFIYDETEDQLKSVLDIKKDMESPKPMDRLVCGDVGFGKTEVAMRAAFKAVMSGYQVAVLVPTTILAAQHFTTFSERMRDFPVKVAVLSRFIKNTEIKMTLDKCKNGQIDIVIGTHRILSQDVVFKNLGLLIIDEEQRFGVQHKEKIQQYRYKVDVLSLTATPIPRTLQLSLIGARDLSIINTPPRNRLPIETIVTPYHDEQLKTAIENELERGGQIYFVNNRINALDLLQDTIERLVPKAKTIIAHGQMNEELLEKIMKEFIAGRYDLLLSTVIIENGLDIPNVNTIVINRADTFGLSQLYQLRGRVGRSSEQAFAYLFTPPFKELTDIGLKRLKALEQYTELGSGFQIAMRDLEIRGAGNILGTRQHGFIEAIGFEMYCRILQDTIKELSSDQPVVKKREVKIEIPVEAYIPNEYIGDGATRIAIYQELTSLADVSSILEFEKMLLDRFGSFPAPVSTLLTIIKLKIYCNYLNIKQLSVSSAQLAICYFVDDTENSKPIISHFLAFQNYNFEIGNNFPISLTIHLIASSLKERCIELLELFQSVFNKLKTLNTSIASSIS